MKPREFALTLPIADRRRAMSFYRDAFGFDVVGEPEEDGVPEPLQLRLDDRVLLTLIPSDGFAFVLDGRPQATPGTSECLLGVTLESVADVDQLVHRVVDSGGSVHTAAVREEWGYTALCSDPDGHLWQVIAP